MPAPRTGRRFQDEEFTIEKKEGELTPDERLRLVREKYIGSPEKEDLFIRECLLFATPIVTGILRGRSKLSDDFKDVASVVARKAALNVENFDGANPLSAWVYRIARNEASDFIRNQHAAMRDTGKTEYIDDMLATGEQLPDKEPTPEAIAVQEGQANLLYEAIEKALDPYDQMLIDMVCFREIPIKEVATILPDTNANALRARLFNARKKLRQYFEESGVRP